MDTPAAFDRCTFPNCECNDGTPTFPCAMSAPAGFDRDLDAWAKARGLRAHTQELVDRMDPLPLGGYVLDEYAYMGEPVTCLTVPTPEPFIAADWERAKRRAQFPANRKGERAFLASERKHRGS